MVVSVIIPRSLGRRTVPFYRSREREGTFSEFCTQRQWGFEYPLLLVERRPGRRQFTADELTSSARYAGHRPTWIWCISRHSLNLMRNCIVSYSK